MKKVYVVGRGSYENNSIEGVFDDHALAEKFVETFGGGMEIRELPVNPFESEMRDGCKPYLVRVHHHDGSILSVNAWDSSHCFGDGGETGFDFKGNMFTYVFAKDTDDAVRVAKNRWIATVAEWRQWLDKAEQLAKKFSGGER